MKQFFSCYVKGMATVTMSLFMLLLAVTKTNAQWIELGGLKGTPFKGGFFTSDYIRSIATDASGNVYAGGDVYDSASFLSNQYVAKWNGKAWSELGGAPFNRGISSIAIDAGRNVYAAGGFTDADSNFSVGKWNGTAWSELGGAPFNSAINSIAIDAGGNVYAAGFLPMQIVITM